MSKSHQDLYNIDKNKGKMSFKIYTYNIDKNKGKMSFKIYTYWNKGRFFFVSQTFSLLSLMLLCLKIKMVILRSVH